MKKYFVLLVIIIVSCKSYKSNNNLENIAVSNLDNYNVYKIDSLNSYYLIYAKRENLLYKIVSKKANCNYEKIKIDSNYKLKLRPMNIMKLKNLPSNDQPMNYLDFIDSCQKLDDSTKVCLERYMTDLYYVDNMKGLCIIKNK